MESNTPNCDNKTDINSEQSKKPFKARNSEYIEINTLNIFKQNSNLINNLTRRYSYDPKICVKNFVPVLRPKESDLNMIPTKLTLNYKKRNSSALSKTSSFDEDDIAEESKDELNLKNSFVNSVSSNSSFNSEDDDNNKINNVRKNFTKIRKYSIFRKNSRNNSISKTLKINLDNEKNDEEDNSIENINLLRKPKKSFQFLSSFKKNENIIFNNFQKNRSRINSISILETLQNKLK